MSDKTILVADDEPWQRMWMTQVLQSAGFTCTTVMDGESVVEEARILSPALIILDIEMPGMSGIEAARVIRGVPETRHIPILFHTSYVEGAALLRTQTVTDSALMMKPFHPDDLLRHVRRFVEQT